LVLPIAILRKKSIANTNDEDIILGGGNELANGPSSPEDKAVTRE